MGMRVNGVWWLVLPNLSEMEEAAESAEEEKDLKAENSSRLCFFDLRTFLL